ncbi:MAG: hypothetical protein PHQ36_07865, partial [Anaerolineales bacterium]|nr:hypothetical protein [Anaerolineales bacterium]
THLDRSGDWKVRERARLGAEVDALIREALVARFREEVPQKKYDEALENIAQRNLSPLEAVKLLIS